MTDQSTVRSMRLQRAITGAPYQEIIDALSAEFSEDTLAIIAASISPGIEEWTATVLRSYKASVTEEEYNLKATPAAAKQVAEYIKADAYPIEYIDDTSNEEPNTTIRLLFDFIAFSS